MFKYRRTRTRLTSLVPTYIMDAIGHRKDKMAISNRRIGKAFTGRQNYTSNAKNIINDGNIINRLSPRQFRNFYEHVKHAPNNRNRWMIGEGVRLVT